MKVARLAWIVGNQDCLQMRFQGSKVGKSWAARKNTFFFDATSVMSIRHANLWVQTHHHFDHSTRQNKTRFQRIFAHVNWVGRCCEICLSRHPLYHWPIDAAWKNVSEIFSIWGLCRCNFLHFAAVLAHLWDDRSPCRQQPVGDLSATEDASMLNRLGALIYIFLFGLVSLEATEVRLQNSEEEEGLDMLDICWWREESQWRHNDFCLFLDHQNHQIVC